jgi:hypothetical protein
MDTKKAMQAFRCRGCRIKNQIKIPEKDREMKQNKLKTGTF